MRIKSAYVSGCALFHGQRLSPSFRKSGRYDSQSQHIDTQFEFQEKPVYHRFASSALASSLRPFAATSNRTKPVERFKYRPKIQSNNKQVFWAISKRVFQIGISEGARFLIKLWKSLVEVMVVRLSLMFVGKLIEILEGKNLRLKKRKTEVTFADVAGCEEEKREMMEVVDFLANSTKFDKVGAKIPKGVLLEGPPGVGKTLLAKAVAGEAKVPFLAVAGSEFIEMYVGVGAQRVRRIFDRARAKAPCILFIDEIDSIGIRSQDNSGGSSEHTQTLNQILTEMDGFEANTGVVVIAATNHAQKLDPAMKRPGRFDRHISMELPDKVGRLEILKVHAKNKPLHAEVNLTTLAANAVGMSGAQLAHVMNEAAIITARNNRTNITGADIENGLDRVTIGVEKKSHMALAKNRKLTSVHESGHAIVAALACNGDMSVRKVTIVPRSGGVGGFTAHTPSDDTLRSRGYYERKIMMCMGGRVAEEIYFGPEHVTSGAAHDLETISQLSHEMVHCLGFTRDKKGKVGSGLSWAVPHNPTAQSEYTRKRVDMEADMIVAEVYLKCKELMLKHKKLLNELTDVLEKEETIDAARFEGIVRSYKEAKNSWF